MQQVRFITIAVFAVALLGTGQSTSITYSSGVYEHRSQPAALHEAGPALPAPAAVPEPATLLLALAAILSMLLLRHRRGIVQPARIARGQRGKSRRRSHEAH